MPEICVGEDETDLRSRKGHSGSRSFGLEQRVESIVLRGHAAGRDRLDLLRSEIPHREGTARQALVALQLFILRRRHEIGRRPSMTGHGDRLTLDDFAVQAESAGELGSRDFTHGHLTFRYGNYVFFGITSRSAFPRPFDAFVAGSGKPCRGHPAISLSRSRGKRENGGRDADSPGRSEEHTSELQSLMRNSYAVVCLKKKKNEHN